MKKLILALFLFLIPTTSFADKPNFLVVVTPDYMECPWCESFMRHAQFLQRKYPELVILSVKVNEETADRLKITGFPTLIIGDKIVGYGTKERKKLQKLLE